MAVRWQTMKAPLASFDYPTGGLHAALEFLKRTRSELRSLRHVRLWKDRFVVVDVNKDCFEIRGIGYEHPDVVHLLRAVNAAFNPDTVHKPPPGEYKEYDTGRRHAWAEDRVM